MPRQTLPRTVVEKCLRVTDADNVAITTALHSVPLAEQIAVECYRKGADVLISLSTDKVYEASLTLLPLAKLKQASDYCRALTEESTAEVYLSNLFDPKMYRTIPAERIEASGEGEGDAHNPLARQRKVRTLSLADPLLTPPRAKAYGYDFPKWRRMMAAASNADADELAASGRALREVLGRAKTVTVTAPGGTDLTFDVGGRKWRVSDGVIDDEDIAAEAFTDSLPAGNISVCPLEDSANGSVAFNVPVSTVGRVVKGVKIKFRDGVATEFEGADGFEVVRAQWESAAGRKDRIAQFQIGFNPGARAGYLVNELVMGGASVAIGGNDFFGGKNKSPFFYSGTRTGATVLADGEPVVKDGALVGASGARGRG